MAHLLDLLADRVLLCDGGTGTSVQSYELDPEKDYLGHESCTEILTRSRPDVIREIQVGYYAAGADIVESNTFGGSPLTLGEFGLADQAYALNKEAAELTREAAEVFKGDGRERFVLGDVGPGTKLPSLGQVAYDALEDAFDVQCRGLIAGGVDGLLVLTCQDLLQVKAAVNGAKRARAAAGSDTPILVQVTIETTGTMLIGSDLAAVAAVVEALDVPLLGLNCATGPREMAEHVRWLGEHWPGLVAVQPNAGLPELVGGRARYPLAPRELAAWLERFVEEDGVNLVGGCCGTNDAHIAAVDAMLRRRAVGGSHRPVPARRRSCSIPVVASLYCEAPLRRGEGVFTIGSRCNAEGYAEFRRLLQAADWDGCVAVARDQAKEGAAALALRTAGTGRDEAADMIRLVERMRGEVTVPLVIESSEPAVLEAALKGYGGKAILSAIDLTGGDEPAVRRLALARRFAAAVIGRTADEAGVAEDADRKLQIAIRLFELACTRHGLAPSDLLIDPLAHGTCTGRGRARRQALHTLEAIERIRAALPDCQVVLEISRISSGLGPAARQVLDSVFLHHAIQRGLTAAIVDPATIRARQRVADDDAEAAEDLIFDRHRARDSATVFASRFEGREPEIAARAQPPTGVEERLVQRIIDGDRLGLEDDLEKALVAHEPMAIINTMLLEGMRVVGDRFGAGAMRLPFVLRSAETMRAAVVYLEPRMAKADDAVRGTIVLATVKGDVHDIGKNLVDIVLTNNGYRVINLGNRQPVEAIVRAAREHRADAVGMSGLLISSALIMRENLEAMTREGLDVPVLIGGAALNRRYVEEQCVPAYGCRRVAYAADIFQGLRLMDRVMDGTFDEHRTRAAGGRQPGGGPARRTARARPLDLEELRCIRAEVRTDVAVPEPPVWGPRAIEAISIEALLPWLNERMLFAFHWGFKRHGLTRERWQARVAEELRPILDELLERCRRQRLLVPQAVYGYWKCAAEGDSLVLFAEDGETAIARFAFPRQDRPGGLCISDFFRAAESGTRDVIALQAVTIGPQASEVARQWLEADRYRDYLYLHGLSVEMAEALAEYVHRRIRAELGFGGQDARDIRRLLRQGYRGSRYSFGYPACPRMADQRVLLRLLRAERIGIRLTESDQLHPEQSTTAIIAHHPQARYFAVGTGTPSGACGGDL